MNMRWMMRGYVLILSVCVLITASPTFAVTPNDCGDFSSSTSDGFNEDVQKKFSENERPLLFFTTKDLKTIFLNLQYACCDEKKSSRDDCADVGGESFYPVSLTLADHLLNIGFRKLDGVEEHCNVLGISCDNRQTVPNLSVKRRERITEIAEDREGYPPIIIQKEFENYWGSKATMTESLKKVETGPREGVDTLYAQYMLLCDEITYIDTRMAGTQREGTANIVSTNAIGLKQTCKDMAEKRYDQEWQYVRTLMVEKAIAYYTQNLESYLLSYFLDNRFDDLVDKYIGLEGCFSTVLKYTTNTACCNE